ncbi:MAG: asparaginase [Clostridia bacterium]|nr:asparaginase [Clostridia bacterium]
MRAEALFEEYRGGVLECVHYGAYALVHERDGLIRQKGDADWSCFYRSASKPIQALPVLMRGLHRKYGLTDEETAILSGSHWGDEEHVRVLESILAKAGLNEEQMVMLPAYPVRPSRKDDLLRKNAAPRKLYHNCAGKHLGLMMLARELGEPVESYWRRNSRAQREVRSMIALVSETPEDRIGVGVDGCGVPVFAVPFQNIARSFLNLARPERIKNDRVAQAAFENYRRVHRHPTMLAGDGLVCSIVAKSPDLLGKSGALGVYAIGIRSLGIGMALKISDGSHAEFEAAVIETLKHLGVAEDVADELSEKYPPALFNGNQELVGFRKSVIFPADG